MPLNINVVIGDKSAEIFKDIKARGRFATNASVITFALHVAAKSEELIQLEKSFQTGWQEGIAVPTELQGVGPVEPRYIAELRSELLRLSKEVEKMKKNRGKQDEP